MRDTFLRLLKENLEGVVAGGSGQIQAYCPFPHSGRSDKDGGSRSFSANYELGVWKCFSCAEHGGMVDLAVRLLKVSRDEAKKYLGMHPKRVREVPPDAMREACEEIANDVAIVDWLLEHRGITKETIYARGLGYSAKEGRVYIPILDEWDRMVDIRRHLVDPERRARKENKSLPYKEGYAVPRIYLHKEIEDKPEVVLLEGEFDAILASQLGFPACSLSGSGALGWQPGMKKIFAGKVVNICYDCDDPGRSGARRIAADLLGLAADVRVINLGLEKPHKDFTDYIVALGHTAEDFSTLIATTPSFVAPPDKIVEGDVHEVDLISASNSRYYAKNVKFNAVVAGKDLAPFIYPKKVHIKCPMSRKPEICGCCGMSAHNGELDLSISHKEDSILRMIDCEDFNQRSEIARRAEICKCPLWEMTVLEAGNIEEVRLIPELDYSVLSTEYVIREAYYVGHGIKANHSYAFIGVAGAHPKTQHSVSVLWQADPAQGMLERKPVTEEMMKTLSIFQVRR